MNQPPFDNHVRRRAFADQLESIHEAITFTDSELDDKWPSIRLHQLIEPGLVQQFLEAWDRYLEQIPS